MKRGIRFLGTIAAISAPIATVIACGSSNKEWKGHNGSGSGSSGTGDLDTSGAESGTGTTATQTTPGNTNPTSISTQLPPQQPAPIVQEQVPTVTFAADHTKDLPPSGPTSKDGVVGFSMQNFDERKMIISSSSGTVDVRHDRVSGISSGKAVTISVSLNDGVTWADGTTAHKTFTLHAPVYTNTPPPVVKTPLNKVILVADTGNDGEPSSKVSQDGKAGFTITNYDPNKMTISASAGHIDLINLQVTGLREGEFSVLKVHLNPGETWVGGTNENITVTLTGPEKQVPQIRQAVISADQHGDVTPSLPASFDGKVGFQLTGYDPTKMDITVSEGHLDFANNQITGLQSGSRPTITITIKTGFKWIGGTDGAITQQFRTPIKVAAPLPLATINVDMNKNVIPSSPTSHDGEMGILLTNYDPNKMSISASEGTVDVTNLKVTGLSSHASVDVTITLNHGERWDNGTNRPVVFNFYSGTAPAAPVVTPPTTLSGLTTNGLQNHKGTNSYPGSMPTIQWNGKPAGTLSYGIIIEDLDYQNAVHGMILGISPTATSVSSSGAGTLQTNIYSIMIQRRTFGNGYWGPWPPTGQTHRYQITLMAFSTTDFSAIRAQLQSVSSNSEMHNVVNTIKGIAIASTSIEERVRG